MSDELDDILNDDGLLEKPTMRGNANIDLEDYVGSDTEGTFLDDELMETPPRGQQGAAPAPDVEGTSQFEMLEEDPSAPGMQQTTYGDHPWGAGSGTGYRPFSQETTDLSGDSAATATKLAIRATSPDSEVPVKNFKAHQRNQMPSNADIDPLTIYDRESYEYDDSPGNVIGSGTFDMEEGMTNRPRDGIFANQFAEPAYIEDEDADGIQQSEMWDVEADNWRVTQVNASGVPLSRRSVALRPAPKRFSPFVRQDEEPRAQLAPMPKVANMRPEVTGPRSHIEAFGRKTAKLMVDEARMIPAGRQRSEFLARATEALGPKMSLKAKLVADRLIKLGFPPDMALEDTLAHCVMHATMNDLRERAQKGTPALPRLDNMAVNLRANQAGIRKAAVDHLQPLVADAKKLQTDLGTFFRSPAALGMGDVVQAAEPAVAPGTPPAAQPAARPSALLTPRNVIIGGAVIGIGYLAATRTEAGRKVTANVRSMFSRSSKSARPRRRSAR